MALLDYSFFDDDDEPEGTLDYSFMDDDNAFVEDDRMEDTPSPYTADGSKLPEARAAEPSIWDSVQDFFTGGEKHRARASNELQARGIADREGITIEEAYQGIRGANRPVLNPEGRPPIRALAEGTEIVAKQVPGVPGAMLNTVLRTIRGGDEDLGDDNFLDRAIEKTEPEKIKDPDPNFASINEIGKSIGYSLTSMTASIGAFAASTMATKNPVAGYAAAFAAAGTVAFRGQKDEFMDRILEVTQAGFEALHDRGMTKEEYKALYDEYNTLGNKYGAWEAIPEALSNLVIIRALSAPLKGLKGSKLQKFNTRAADISKRYLAVQAGEQATETATAWGQNRVDLEAGLTNWEMSIGDAFRQQVLPTAIVTTAMAGGGALVQKMRGQPKIEDLGPPVTDSLDIDFVAENIKQEVYGGKGLIEGQMIPDPYGQEVPVDMPTGLPENVTPIDTGRTPAEVVTEDFTRPPPEDKKPPGAPPPGGAGAVVEIPEAPAPKPVDAVAEQSDELESYRDKARSDFEKHGVSDRDRMTKVEALRKNVSQEASNAYDSTYADLVDKAVAERVASQADEVAKPKQEALKKPQKTKAEFKAHVAELRDKKETGIQSLKDSNDGNTIGIEAQSTDGKRFAVVLPDASEPGRFRVQNYDKSSFSGHQVYNTEQEALDAMWADGYRKSAQGAMNKLEGTPAWKQGMKFSDQVRIQNEESFAKTKALEKEKTALAKPLSKPTGRSTSVYIPSIDSELKAKVSVVEGSALTVSNDQDGVVNPAYPKELQPRDRRKGSSMLQIHKMAANLKPELLDDNGQSNGGSPIVGPDGVVESGNGRTLAIIRAYQTKAGDAYREYLKKNAASYGLSEADIDAMENPVLVRVRQGDMTMDERAEFARQSNQAGTAPMTPVENARADARRITDEDMLLYEPSGQGNILAASNQPFLQKFGSRLGDLEVGGLSTPDGRWTKQFADRVQAAVFYKAYGNDSLLALVAEEADPDIKNVLSALNQAAPAFARARAVQKDLSGKKDLGDLDIITDIVEAIDLLRQAKKKGSSITQEVDQGGLFGGVDPVVGQLAKFIEGSMRSAKKMGLGFTAMANTLETELQTKTQEGLFELRPATKADLVEAASRQVGAEYGEADFFDVEDMVASRGLPKEKSLVVAARTPDGKIVKGKPGQLHFQLAEDHNLNTGNERTPLYTEGNPEMGFADESGKFLTREEAIDHARSIYGLGVRDQGIGLMAEDLKEARDKQPAYKADSWDPKRLLARRGEPLKDLETRRADAKKAGFDVSTVYYHGTNRDFNEFSKPVFIGDPGVSESLVEEGDRIYAEFLEGLAPEEKTFMDEMKAKMGPGYSPGRGRIFDQLRDKLGTRTGGGDYHGGEVFFFTDNPTLASDYAGMETTAGNVGGANVIPVYLKKGRALRIDAKGKDWRDFLQRIEKARKSGKYDSVILTNYEDNAVPTGLRGLNTTVAVFSSDKIRSVHAQFNDLVSGDLLARRGDPYAAMAGKDISYKVKVEDTGKVYTLTVDAGKAMNDIDTRIDDLRELRKCI